MEDKPWIREAVQQALSYPKYDDYVAHDEPEESDEFDFDVKPCICQNPNQALQNTVFWCVAASMVGVIVLGILIEASTRR